MGGVAMLRDPCAQVRLVFLGWWRNECCLALGLCLICGKCGCGFGGGGRDFVPITINCGLWESCSGATLLVTECC
eukprot:11705053-Ditylum_brightwellii.AAC.1